MNRSRYAPMPRQAEQTGKAFPDIAALQQRRANATDGDKASKVYPGGETENMSWILAGEILICPRNNKTGTIVGLTSVAGLDASIYGGCVDAIMRNFYFGGVPFEDIQIGGDSLFGTNPLDHGFGITMAGAATVTNIDLADHPPGTTLAWCFPDRNNNTNPRNATGVAQRSLTIDNGFTSAATTRQRFPEGTVREKPLVELRVFNPYDASLQLQAVSWAIGKNKAQGGVLDMTVDDFDHPDKPYTTLQEQAFAWRESLRTIAAASAEWTQKSKITTVGKDLYDALDKDKMVELMKFLMLRNAIDNKTEIGTWEAIKTTDYGKARDRAFDLLAGGVAGALYTRMERIVGKSISGAKGGKGRDEYVSFRQ